jgi:transposase
MMPITRSPYPPEFKAEAVRLYKESGRSLQEIATDLGVSSNSLRDWVNRSKVGRNERVGLSQDEREELKRLRHENRILREEREILKKAAAFFAQETSRSR